MFTDCRLPMKTPLFPLAVIAALLLSLPARADGKAGEAAADSVQKSKEKESIEQPTTANPDKLPAAGRRVFQVALVRIGAT